MPQCQDEPYHHRQKELPPLCQEIPEVYIARQYLFFFLLLHLIYFIVCTFYDFISSYQFLFNNVRYEKRHSNIPAHISPCFRVKEGDHVIIGQCRYFCFTDCGLVPVLSISEYLTYLVVDSLGVLLLSTLNLGLSYILMVPRTICWSIYFFKSAVKIIQSLKILGLFLTWFEIYYRPLSKTVRFNVLKVIPAGSTGGGGKKAFTAV